MSDAVVSSSLEATFRALDVAQILSFVSDQRLEDLTLDFKLAPQAFGRPEERKVLAKAISGFANSSGGVIVWGIDGRKGDDSIDGAQEAVPLENGPLFMSRLVEHGGNATSPPVPGVVHRLIEGAGGPFAVTYVPESDTGPHMAKLGEDRYYKRSGDRFYRMEHFDIADMFGRRARPDLRLFVEARARIVLGLENVGRGGAIAPYLEVILPSGVKVDQAGVDGAGAFGLLRLPHAGDNAHEPHFGGNRSMMIYPSARHDVAVLKGPIAKGQIYFYAVATEGTPLTEHELVIK
jgi:hypothetical protein